MRHSPSEFRTNAPLQSPWEAIRRAYDPSGGARAQIRRNQLLPLDWKHLTDGDMWEIAKLLWAEPSTDVSEIELEALLAIAAILTTGRNLGRLHDLKVYKNMQCLRDDNAREGLILKRGNPVWSLIAGSPARQEEIKAKSLEEAERDGEKGYRKIKSARARPVLPHPDDREIAIPVAPIVVARLQHRNIKAGNRPARLFHHRIEQLTAEIERLLKTRRGLGVAEPRRCSWTLESVTRFLTVEMTHQAGADIATAARLTDSTHPSSRTVMYYGVCRSRDHGKRIQKATRRLEPRGPSGDSSPSEEQQLGSLLAPTDHQVKALIARLREDLNLSSSCSGTPDEKHRAMLTHTVALVSFATGHRGLGTYLPSTAAIDSYTGFCRINEKYEADRSEVRMVWVAGVAREQIAEYERHLELLKEISPSKFQPIQNEVSQGRLPIFKLDSGVPVSCNMQQIWTLLHVRAPNLECIPANGGRHWLRSNLDGKCSTETLHAMFGHWHIGAEPWSYGSCFDPVIFRADLERTIPDCLKNIGWEAISSPLANGHG